MRVAATKLPLKIFNSERNAAKMTSFAIAAVLADDPRITILDEPGAGLDLPLLL